MVYGFMALKYLSVANIFYQVDMSKFINRQRPLRDNRLGPSACDVPVQARCILQER